MRRSRQLRRLAGSFALLTLLTFLGVFAIFYQNIRDNANREIRQALRDQASSIDARLDAEVYNLDRIALGMLGSKDFVDSLVQLNVTGAQNTLELTKRKYEYQKLVDRLIFSLNTPILTSPMIDVFDVDHGYFFGWSIRGLDQPAIYRAMGSISWAEEAAARKGAKLLVPVRQNEWTTRTDPVFSIVRAVMTTKDKLMGILEVQQGASAIQEACATGFSTQTVVVVDDQGEQIYPFAPVGYLDRRLGAGGASQESSVRLEGLKGTQLYASKRSEYTGWTVIALRPEDDVLHTAKLAYRLVAFSLIAVLLISLCAVVLISRRLTAPIRALRASVEQADAAELTLMLPGDDGSDEVSQLKRSFERLLERINLSTRQRVQAQQEEARAYLLALQSQMSPHFLYNTLNTIGLIAEENGQQVVADISRQLVGMLRYVGDFSRSKVPLSEEIAFCEKYLSLLKSRYEDGLSYAIEVKGDTEAVIVPKLILQPLCENSYLHGLYQVTPPWRIDVAVEAQPDGGFVIKVSDNGRGFSEEALRDLRGRIAGFRVSENPAISVKQMGLNNIGLISTHSRLYIEYGGRVRLDIMNLDGGGCAVEIRVENGGDERELPTDAGGG